MEWKEKQKKTILKELKFQRVKKRKEQQKLYLEKRKKHIQILKQSEKYSTKAWTITLKKNNLRIWTTAIDKKEEKRKS